MTSFLWGIDFSLMGYNFSLMRKPTQTKFIWDTLDWSFHGRISFSTCNSLFIRYNSLMAITRRQKEVIDFLSGFTQKNGYSPSYEEIASGLGLSSLATVHKHVTNLQNKGLLQ